MTAQSTIGPSSQPDSNKPIPGSPTFARDFNSFLRNILLANPFFARICAEAWQSARPNSLVTKLLQLNYQKNLLRNPMSNIRSCTHIKVTGVRCGSPALRGEEYCYFHYRMLCESRVSHVALLENEEAIQVSLMEVVNSLLRGTIDVKRGELVLRALNTAVRNSRRARFENRSDMVRELPEPVVQPRPRKYSHEELEAMQKEMWAEYNKSKQAAANADASSPSTAQVGANNPAPAPITKNVGADAFVRPAPAQPVREARAHASQNSQSGKTSVDPKQRKPAREIDPMQRKPPAGVKESAAPQERKNTAHGVSRGKAG